jgi:hypothetical protein
MLQNRSIQRVFFKCILKVVVEELIVNVIYGLRVIFLNLTFLGEWWVHNRVFRG